MFVRIFSLSLCLIWFSDVASCGSSSRSSVSSDDWENPAENGSFRSHWLKSMQMLDTIYEKDNELAIDLLKLLERELNEILQCCEGAKVEKERTAEAIEHRAHEKNGQAFGHK